MENPLHSLPPDLNAFMQDQSTTPEAMAFLRTEFQEAANPPVFFAICPIIQTPFSLKLLDVSEDFDEIGIVHYESPTTEIKMTMFGLTLCGKYKYGGAGTNIDLLVEKPIELYRGVLRDIYTFEEPVNASDVMTLAFARQDATISKIMDIIIDLPRFRSARLKKCFNNVEDEWDDMDEDEGAGDREGTVEIDEAEEQEENEGKGDEEDNEGNVDDDKDNKTEDNDSDDELEEYVNVKVLGPPILKIAGVEKSRNVESILDLFNGEAFRNVKWKVDRPMEEHNHPTIPRDEIFDVDQKRTQNWQGHLIFDEESVTLMQGYLRFRVVEDNYLQAFFVAESMKKVAGNNHRWKM